MNKIRAIILDVDGVIVGDKKGFNAPYPPLEVINKLKQIRRKNIYIILCSAKPYYSVKKIVEDAQLNNIQTALAGAILVDPVDLQVIKKHVLDNNVAVDLTKQLLDNNIYTEIYTTDKYYIQKNQKNQITELHSFTLSFEPILVDNLIKQVQESKIVKILPVTKTDQERKIVDQIFLEFKEKLMIGWSTHPAIKGYFFGNITAHGISKKQSILEIVKMYEIKSQEMLGVGDSLTDWDFIGICGYAGAMGNAVDDLKTLVLSKGKNGYVGKPVDEDGILDIFEYFGL
ncbi:MAG: HAD family hydrolase [Patescibacteria group bacterium]|jgi:HAD superfamily hydrolase (TIGR01484 family)